MKNVNGIARVIAALTLILGLTTARPTLAGPALFWWHMNVDTDRAGCLRRARQVMADERVPLRREDNGTIWGWHDDVTTSIKCTSRGNNSHVIIIVTSNDQQFAEGLLNSFRAWIGN